MKSEKLSISLEADLAETIRGYATKEGVSVSSWIAEASAQKARQQLLEELVKADALELGALSDEEVDRHIAEARAASEIYQSVSQPHSAAA